MATFSGDFHTPTGRFGLIAARFNSFIVEHLVKGALDGFQRHGVSEVHIDIVYVPGSLELGLVAKQMARSNKYKALIAMGAIIQGETDHYDVVVRESAHGLSHAALESGIPVINAILTTSTLEQAINRAGAKQGNKGFEAALAAIEMTNLLEKLKP